MLKKIFCGFAINPCGNRSFLNYYLKTNEQSVFFFLFFLEYFFQITRADTPQTMAYLENYRLSKQLQNIKVTSDHRRLAKKNCIFCRLLQTGLFLSVQFEDHPGLNGCTKTMACLSGKGEGEKRVILTAWINCPFKSFCITCKQKSPKYIPLSKQAKHDR